jgi:hypothetical protein
VIFSIKHTAILSLLEYLYAVLVYIELRLSASNLASNGYILLCVIKVNIPALTPTVLLMHHKL